MSPKSAFGAEDYKLENHWNKRKKWAYPFVELLHFALEKSHFIKTVWFTDPLITRPPRFVPDRPVWTSMNSWCQSALIIKIYASKNKLAQQKQMHLPKYPESFKVFVNLRAGSWTVLEFSVEKLWKPWGQDWGPWQGCFL